MSLLDMLERGPVATVRSLLADAAALVARSETASTRLREIAAILASDLEPAPVAVPVDEDAEEELETLPCCYGECLTLGLGREHPCPFYSCRNHLGLETRVDKHGVTHLTKVLIDPETIETAAHTCALEAADRIWTPDEIATQLGISIGLEELIQRRALLDYSDGMLEGAPAMSVKNAQTSISLAVQVRLSTSRR